MKKAPSILATLAPTGLFGSVVWVILFLGGEASASPDGPIPALSSGIAPESAAAMFLLGLAVGVPAGIGLFFAYLIHREKSETAQDRELDALMHGPSPGEGAAPGVWDGEHTGSRGAFEQQHEGCDERHDPWERPADWWKHAGDDA